MSKFEVESVPDEEILKNIFEDKTSRLAIIGDTHIMISESKLKLYLTNHVSKLEKKNSWITPLSLSSGFLISLITCDFKGVIFNKAVWEALFIIVSIICFLWLIYTLKYTFQSITVDDIIAELKKDQINFEK